MTAWSNPLLSFQDALKCPYAVQVTADKDAHRREKIPLGVRLLVSAERFLALLP